MYNEFKDKIDLLFYDCSIEVREHLAKAFAYLYSTNQNEVINIFDMLCKIKEKHQEFLIVFSNKSNFDNNEKVINLARNNYLVLIHEIAHAIHYYCNGYNVPKDFYNVREEIIDNQEVLNNSNHLLTFLDEYIKKISLQADDSNVSDSEYDYLLLEQKRLLETKDFVDALYGGITGSGHGSRYYEKDDDKSLAFSEMFANFVVIKSLKDSDRIILLLKNVFGKKLIEIFEREYYEMIVFYKNNDKKAI